MEYDRDLVVRIVELLEEDTYNLNRHDSTVIAELVEVIKYLLKVVRA